MASPDIPRSKQDEPRVPGQRLPAEHKALAGRAALGPEIDAAAGRQHPRPEVVAAFQAAARTVVERIKANPPFELEEYPD